jgi:uncharacterized protein (UPF0332 family)
MTPEILALLDKARASHRASVLLSQQGYPDFAASRAYYAMFYTAEALLLSRGLSFSSHAAVIAAFGREFARSKDLDAKFHRYLIDAQDVRNLGDYGIGPGVREDQLQELLTWAQEFLAAAGGLLSPDRH